MKNSVEEIGVGIEEKVNEMGVSLRLDGRMLVARINWNRRGEKKLTWEWIQLEEVTVGLDEKSNEGKEDSCGSDGKCFCRNVDLKREKNNNLLGWHSLNKEE